MAGITINTNPAQMSAQRSLSVNSSEAARQISILSSGNKITKASDDSAGDAIATRLNAITAALDQARNNGAQGASVVQVASGGVKTIVSALNRLKTLATQSNSDALTPDQRSYANAEYQSILKQIDMTADQTRWSGNSLLTNLGAGNSVKNTRDFSGSVGTLTATEALYVDQNFLSKMSDINNSTGAINGFVKEVVVIGANAQTAFSAANYIQIMTSTGEVFETATVNGAAGTSMATANAGAALEFVAVGDTRNRFKVNLGTNPNAATLDNVKNALQKLFKVTGDDTTNKFTFNVGQSAQLSNFKTDGTNFLAANSSGTANNTIGPVRFDSASTNGNISGLVSDVKVSANATTPANADIRITVGGQVFDATNVNVAAATTMTFTSQTDATNKFTLTLSAAFGNFAKATNDFRTFFRLDMPPETRPAVEFKSASLVSNATNYTKNGIDSFEAPETVRNGDFTLAYDQATKRFDLRDGTNTVYSKTCTVAELGGGKSIEFGNGISVKLNNDFDYTQNIAQLVINITPKDKQLDFQVADRGNDIIRVNISAATVKALGLTGTDIATKETASIAGDIIDTAINKLNTLSADLGANQRRFELSQTNLSIAIENLKIAKGSFVDADIASSMGEYTKFNVLAQISQAMSVQSNEMIRQLTQLTR